MVYRIVIFFCKIANKIQINHFVIKIPEDPVFSIRGSEKFTFAISHVSCHVHESGLNIFYTDPCLFFKNLFFYRKIIQISPKSVYKCSIVTPIRSNMGLIIFLLNPCGKSLFFTYFSGLIPYTKNRVFR